MVGAPDEEWGEVVVAVIVTRDGQPIDTAELDEWCKSEIAAFKRPKHYLFRSDMPKNSYGKIPKIDLRAEVKAALGRK